MANLRYYRLIVSDAELITVEPGEDYNPAEVLFKGSIPEIEFLKSALGATLGNCELLKVAFDSFEAVASILFVGDQFRIVEGNSPHAFYTSLLSHAELTVDYLNTTLYQAKSSIYIQRLIRERFPELVGAA